MPVGGSHGAGKITARFVSQRTTPGAPGPASQQCASRRARCHGAAPRERVESLEAPPPEPSPRWPAAGRTSRRGLPGPSSRALCGPKTDRICSTTCGVGVGTRSAAIAPWSSRSRRAMGRGRLRGRAEPTESAPSPPSRCAGASRGGTPRRGHYPRGLGWPWRGGGCHRGAGDHQRRTGRADRFRGACPRSHRRVVLLRSPSSSLADRTSVSPQGQYLIPVAAAPRTRGADSAELALFLLIAEAWCVPAEFVAQALTNTPQSHEIRPVPRLCGNPEQSPCLHHPR